MPPKPEESAAPRRARWGAALAREPLVHFALAGALLFLGYAGLEALRQPTVRITQQDVAQIVASFTSQAQRPPNREELDGAISERIDEEIMAAEARRLGLDQGDVILRRRLAQKYAFVREDVLSVPEPSRDDLERYFATHMDAFTAPPSLAFRHVYFSVERGDAAARSAAQRALAVLAKAPDTAISGDVFMLPLSYADVEPQDLVRDYGGDFAQALAHAPIGAWSGPVRSAYGWHVVRLEARRDAAKPSFADALPQVRDRWLDEARAKRRAAEREKLRSRYRIVVEHGA